MLAKKIFDEGKVSFAREIFENELAREFFSMKGGEEAAETYRGVEYDDRKSRLIALASDIPILS